MHYYNLDLGIVWQPISLEFRFCPSYPDYVGKILPVLRGLDFQMHFGLSSPQWQCRVTLVPMSGFQRTQKPWDAVSWLTYNSVIVWSRVSHLEVQSHPWLCVPVTSFQCAQVIVWLHWIWNWISWFCWKNYFLSYFAISFHLDQGVNMDHSIPKEKDGKVWSEERKWGDQYLTVTRNQNISISLVPPKNGP